VGLPQGSQTDERGWQEKEIVFLVVGKGYEQTGLHWPVCFFVPYQPLW
jgi:hypothetical protein